MSTPTLQDIVEKMLRMETRIAALESRTPGASVVPAAHAPDEEIPWTVIAAAVATLLPGAFRIAAVELHIPMPSTNWWGMEGRTEHFNSHRIH